MMNISELNQLLDFFKQAEKLKDTLRTGITAEGRRESVAEHTWRLCLMASLFHNRYFPQLDFQKLIKTCLIHDLGEAINGDIPAPRQDNNVPKSNAERKDLVTMLRPLPERFQKEFLRLWEEYESASTEEAKLAKALDKLETIIQHNQGKNPKDFDYEFNLTYGKQYTLFDESVALLRALVDEETRKKIAEAIDNSPSSS